MPWCVPRFAPSSKYPESHRFRAHAALNSAYDVVIIGVGGHAAPDVCADVEPLPGGEVLTAVSTCGGLAHNRAPAASRTCIFRSARNWWR